MNTKIRTLFNMRANPFHTVREEVTRLGCMNAGKLPPPFFFHVILCCYLLSSHHTPLFSRLPSSSIIISHLLNKKYNNNASSNIHNSAMSSSVRKHQEVILRVISPVLTYSSSITLISQVCAGNSTWDVTLLQQAPKLAVAVVWNRRDHRDMTGYNAMYVVPHQAPGKAINRVQVDASKFSAGQAVACKLIKVILQKKSANGWLAKEFHPSRIGC
jgi:hypothetical protein